MKAHIFLQLETHNDELYEEIFSSLEKHGFKRKYGGQEMKTPFLTCMIKEVEENIQHPDLGPYLKELAESKKGGMWNRLEYMYFYKDKVLSGSMSLGNALNR